MPKYVYEFEETGETIEVEQKMSDKTHEFLMHPEKLKLMKVKRLISGGVGVIFKGDGWTPPGNLPSSHAVKFPSGTKIDEKAVKNEGFRSAPKKANAASPEKLKEARQFQNWLDKGGGADALNKQAPSISTIKNKDKE